MLVKLLFVFIAIFAYFWTKSWYQTLNAEQRKNAHWNIVIGAVIALMLFAVITGRMHVVGLVVAIALGMFKFIFSYFLRFAPTFFSFAKSHNFSTPEINTPYLRLKIIMGNPTRLEGKVIDGPYQNKLIQELSQEELVELSQFYKDKCKRSYYLILATLQNSNKQRSEFSNFDDAGGMSYDEARQILGLEETFSDEDVKLAYKKLIQKLHPDKGGNAYLAARINLAKDKLLQSN